DILGNPASRGVGFSPEGGGRRVVGRRRIDTRQLVEYGMLAEFLGRVPVLVQLDELGAEELMEILTGPPDAILREYRQLLALDGVDLNVTEGALRRVVALAVGQGLGARGLRCVMEELMEEALFLAPEQPGRPWTIDARYVEERLPACKEALRSVSTSSALRA